jgi:hypothetical protein
MGLIALFLIPIVLFFWFAFMFTLYTVPAAIWCLTQNQYIRASLWTCAGMAMLFWWDGEYSWKIGLPEYVVLIGAGVIAAAWRYSKRMRQTAVPTWTPPPPPLPPDTTNIIPFVRLHVSGAARRGLDRSG